MHVFLTVIAIVGGVYAYFAIMSILFEIIDAALDFSKDRNRLDDNPIDAFARGIIWPYRLYRAMRKSIRRVIEETK